PAPDRQWRASRFRRQDFHAARAGKAGASAPTMKTLGPRIKPAPSRVRAPDKQALPFYLSPEWRGLMARLLKERGRVCQHCGRTECRIFGDHRIELKDGGAALDPRNIELCAVSVTASILRRLRRLERPPLGKSGGSSSL